MSWDKSIKIWDPKEKNILLQTITAHDDAITCIVELKSGLIVTASLDQTISVWKVKYENNTSTNKKKLNFIRLSSVEAHEDGILALTEISLNTTNLLASASYDKTVQIWNIEGDSGALSKNKTLIGHQWAVSDIIQIKSGQLVSASWDKNISIWNPLNDFALEKTFVAHSDAVNKLIELYSGNIASAGADNLIKIWVLNSLDKPFSILEGHKGPVNSFTELLNGLLISTSDDKTIRIWEVNNDNLFEDEDSIIAHNDAILGIKAFASDALFATTSKDNTIKLWDKSMNNSKIGVYIIIAILVSALIIAIIATFFLCRPKTKKFSGENFVKVANDPTINIDF